MHRASSQSNLNNLHAQVVKTIACFLPLMLLLLSCSESGGSESASEADPIDKTTMQAEPFVLLELFTSEGCSDCPAAEALANKLALEAWADRSYVYVLSFHVDYWNKLGWPDPFSDASYSDRQRAYRKSLGNEVVYTPQLVINGAYDLVGSDSLSIDSAISVELRQTPPLYFTITPNDNWSSIQYDVISFDHSLAMSGHDLVMYTAVVQRNLVTSVPRGENAGRTLQHENVVIQFNKHPFKMSGGHLVLPGMEALDEHFSLVAFVQDPLTKAVLGANIWNH